MLKRYKANACLLFLLAVVFYLFWQICKQQPALAQVATFTEDPYDAIGSFATQFALFTALLSIVRAFRPYEQGITENQQVLFVRGAYLTCLAVAVTLWSDVVAMLRFPDVWFGLTAGWTLAALVGGMALLTALMGWSIHRVASGSMTQSTHRGWIRATALSIAGAIICALYPQNWSEGFPTGGLGTAFILFTAFLGMAIFFVVVWAWDIVLFPEQEPPVEDFIDDLAAFYGGFKANIGFLWVLLTPFEKILSSSLLRPIVSWLNPRKDRWYGIALIGILIGIGFALGEGHLHPRVGILALFASIECLGVLVGYALFVLPLRLARSDAKEKTRASPV